MIALRRMAGRTAEAIEHGVHAVERCRTMHGPDHPMTLHALNAIGRCLAEVGRFDEALTMFEEAHAGRSAALGPAHPATLTAGHNRATILFRLGRLTEALSLAREVAEARTALYGVDHADTRDTQRLIEEILGGE